MNKKKTILFMLLGATILFAFQNFFFQPSYAENENLISESDNVIIQNTVNFEKAAEKAIKAVVHIKSKYLEDEIYRYYDPFFGNRYFNNPREKVIEFNSILKKFK